MSSPLTGFHCLMRGLELSLQPGLRRYILVPLVINTLIFATLGYWAVREFSVLLQDVLALLPDWLVAISQWLLTLLFALFLALFCGYSFSLLANLVAAPFNGLLAEAVALRLTGEPPPPESLWHLTVRSLLRELRKLLYFLPRYLGVLLLTLLVSLVPLLNLLAPAIPLLWGAWSLMIQYADYAADNQQTGFDEMRQHLAAHRSASLMFGGCVLAAAMLPVVNLVVMPVAVCGATAFWLETRGKTLRQ